MYVEVLKLVLVKAVYCHRHPGSPYLGDILDKVGLF